MRQLFSSPSLLRLFLFPPVPGAPERLRGVVTGPSSALVSWGRPRRHQGALLHYTLYTQARGHVSHKNLLLNLNNCAIFISLHVKDFSLL